MFGRMLGTVRRLAAQSWTDGTLSPTTPPYPGSSRATKSLGGPCQLTEVAVQVRLVDVAALVGHVGPAAQSALDAPADRREAVRRATFLGGSPTCRRKRAWR
jgi:hypothetical protein